MAGQMERPEHPMVGLGRLEPEVKRMLSDEVTTGEAEAFEALELCSKLMDLGPDCIRLRDDITLDMIRGRVGKLQRKFGWQ